MRQKSADNFADNMPIKVKTVFFIYKDIFICTLSANYLQTALFADNLRIKTIRVTHVLMLPGNQNQTLTMINVFLNIGNH
jgi:hypothetical protein